MTGVFFLRGKRRYFSPLPISSARRIFRLPVKTIVLSVLIFLVSCAEVYAQVPAPPAGNSQNSWTPEIPRRQWTLGINAGIIGFSPSETVQISGDSHFTRLGGNFGFGVVTDNKGHRRLSLTANTSFGISAGTILANKKGTKFHTIEGVFQRNKACYSFDSPFYFSFDGDTFARWIMTDKYFYYGLSYQYTWSVAQFNLPSDYMYSRVTFGATFYHVNFDEKIYQGKYEDWTENGTGMRATTIAASKTSPVLSFELGFRSFEPDYDRSFDWGIVAHIPFRNSYTDQYEFVQNNTSLGVSNTTYSGTTIMMNFRYTFNFKAKEREPDTTVAPPDIYVSTDTSRSIDVQESFEVHHKHVRVRVWDRNEVDGDVVSLFMNDQLIKKNLKLRRRKKSFTVKLNPGSNILVMYAENLGSIPPNTAALEIKDGKKKRNVNLVSDNGKSGAVELIYVPK